MGEGRIRAALFVGLNRAFTRGLRLLETIHQGLWLGWMNRPALARATAAWYDATPRYADPSYNRSGLLAWEEAALAARFQGCESILLAACGGGREARALAERGLEVTAFDCNERLVEACRANLADVAAPSSVLLTLPDEAPPNLGPHDALVVGWGGYMHIPGRARRTAFLRACRASLRGGAPVLLSFFVRPESSRWFAWTRRIATVVRRLRFSAERVELGDALPGTFDHHFTEAEIREELVEAGFSLLTFHASPYPHAVARSASQEAD